MNHLTGWVPVQTQLRTQSVPVQKQLIGDTTSEWTGLAVISMARQHCDCVHVCDNVYDDLDTHEMCVFWHVWQSDRHGKASEQQPGSVQDKALEKVQHYNVKQTKSSLQQVQYIL